MLRALGLCAPVLLVATTAFAAPPQPRAEAPAIARGVQYLKAHTEQGQAGEAALVLLALIKADVPASDPAVVATLGTIRKRFRGGTYTPERSGGLEIYEAAVIAMALANLDPAAFKAEIAAAVQYLITKQKTNGAWDYEVRAQMDTGDTSISQYAILGLWEAENAGVEVPPKVWDRAARWFLSVQSPQGSWNYHRDEVGRYPETISMTAAGVGSLLICQRQLEQYRKTVVHPLLTPLVPEQRVVTYTPETSNTRIDRAVKSGIAWIARYFGLGANSAIGQSPYYGLYGLERVGALADKDAFGNVNWFQQGLNFIRSTQQPSGGWNAQHGDVPNTAWAVLFLTRSTAQSIKKFEIKRLGAGTLLGGRGLPKDLSSLTIAGGRVVVRPMNGAIDSMIDVLEDPRALNADSALAGLVNRYHAQGPKVLRPYKDRFRKLLNDRDPGVRRVAAWALGRTGDLDVAPALITALADPDDAVVGEARTGLQLLSRKLDGYGPPPGATEDQRKEAVAKWRAWYQSVRSPDLADLD
ncbi:MAG: HEAT repeat domain-containing protein [Isosphaeraceae bacterium]|nr:HEAT repeat domain-containing protein [Isosphaeraceae bacterium]